MDKLQIDELEFVRIPLKSFVSSPVCPKDGGVLQRNNNKKAEMGEDIATSFIPHECTSCDYEVMLPATVGNVEYENLNIDSMRSPLRDQFGHSGVIALIWARTHNRGIGHKGELPWGRDFPTDLKWFKAVTTHNPDALLVVGRTTFENLPPLEGRNFAVLTTTVSAKTPILGREGSYYYPDIPTLIDDQSNTDLIVIGGGYCYDQWMPMADIMYETVIYGNYPVDTFAPIMRNGDFINLDTHRVQDCDDTGKDVIFNIWLAAKAKGTLEEFILRDRWNIDIEYKLFPERFAEG